LSISFKYAQASKGSKSQAQLEKERKLKEHRQKILKQHAPAGGKGGSASASQQQASASPRATSELTKSVFQELFSQRAQGFQIDFRFRNAPPRPPVGPTFVGHSLDSILLEQCQRYKPLNAVEVQHKWRLHSEVDVGVPLAPSAMDLKSYNVETTTSNPALPRLHPDDADLLDWSGPMGDTAADRLKLEQERKRIKDRQLLSGKRSTFSAAAAQQSSPNDARAASGRAGAAAAGQKKVFSRVLDEGMQTWMKKTTYLSNDYSRKVHDFKSLAQTKQDVAQDLQLKQDEMTKRRSATAVSKGFAPLDLASIKHPVRPGLKPVAAYELLPSVPHWGSSVTHVAMDKPPPAASASASGDAAQLLLERIRRSFVGNVERNPAKARMSCQLFVPAADDTSGADAATPNAEDEAVRYDAVGAYDLEVLPLKEEDSPHSSFVLVVDRDAGVITYLPVSSRVQLSRGRPVRAPGGYCLVSKRPLTDDEVTEREERAAEVDPELSEKHGIPLGGGGGGAGYLNRSRKRAKATPSNGNDDLGGAKAGSNHASKSNGKDDGDEEDDFGDDDSSDSEDETMFGSAAKTIVAEG
jgi:Paf1